MAEVQEYGKATMVQVMHWLDMKIGPFKLGWQELTDAEKDEYKTVVGQELKIPA